MSHIPNAAMPHAAPHHDDPAMMTMDRTATASDAPPAAIAKPAPTRNKTSVPSARGESAPARSGWGVAALVAGGAALSAGAVLFSAAKRKREA